MLFPEIFFHFGEKYRIYENIFGMSGKLLSYLGKMSEKFFWDDLGAATFAGGNF